jgi:hypothetical protein
LVTDDIWVWDERVEEHVCKGCGAWKPEGDEPEFHNARCEFDAPLTALYVAWLDLNDALVAFVGRALPRNDDAVSATKDLMEKRQRLAAEMRRTYGGHK